MACVLTQRRTDGMRCAIEITQEQDSLIAHSLPGHRGKVGIGKRHVRNAFLHVVAHGGNWHGLPHGFGNWQTNDTRLSRCSKAGVRDRIVATRQQAQILRLRIAAVRRDATHRKVHPDGTEALKKWQTIAWTVQRRMDHQTASKQHRIAAAVRTGVACCVSPGDPQDAPGGRGWMEPIGAVKQSIALLLDRAFAGDDTRRQARRLGYQPVVPPKSNRRSPWQYDGLLSRRRNAIERLLRRLKRYRHVFTRYDT